MRDPYPIRVRPVAIAAGRLLSLLRVLMMAAAAALVLVVPGVEQSELLAHEAVRQDLGWLLGVVALATVTVAIGIGRWRLMRWPVVQALADVLWVAVFVYLTGGVLGSGVPLLFAVVLGGNLILLRCPPFLLSAAAALAVVANAVLYLAEVYPADLAGSGMPPELVESGRIITVMVFQIGALVVVDLLVQMLMRRWREERWISDELLERLTEGVMVVDRRGLVLYGNAAVMELLALASPVAAGQHLAAVLDDGCWAALTEAMTTAATPPRYLSQTIGERELGLHVQPLIGRRGREIARCLTVVDQTAVKRLQQEAARSERLASFGEMAAGIAHEVRNPLASLRGCAQELRDMLGAELGGDARVLIDILLNESDRMGRIIEDFLRLSRVRSAQPEPVVIGEALQAVVTQVKNRQDLPPDLALSSTIDDAVPQRIHVDPDQLHQVLLNLIENALDAVREQASPVITCAVVRQDDGAVCVMVTDNGCGMPTALQERVFTPFVSTKSQGSGLGLSLVQRLVVQHGGTVQLHSQAGQGTTVVCVFPQNRTPGQFSAGRSANTVRESAG